MKVRFCKHNKVGSKLAKRFQESFPKASVKVKDCIGKCGLCHKAPFALVDGKPVAAIDGEELFARLVEEMARRS